MNEFSEELRVIGHRMRKARLDKGLTQEEVARLARISQPSLSSHEAGYREPGAIEVKHLAVIYEVSSDWLLGLTDSSES